MAVGFNLNDPKYQKMVAGILFGIIILGAFYMYVIGPQKREIGELKNKIQKEEAEVKRLIALSNKIPDLRAELESKEGEIVRISKSLPTRQEVPALLKQITNATQQASVKLSAFDPGKLTATGEYEQFKVDINVRGSYHDLGDLLSRVSNLSRIINVGNLSIKIGTSAQAAAGETITAGFDLIAYVYDPAKAPPPKSKKKK